MIFVGVGHSASKECLVARLKPSSMLWVKLKIIVLHCQSESKVEKLNCETSQKPVFNCNILSTNCVSYIKIFSEKNKIQNCEVFCFSIVMVSNQNTSMLLTHVKLNIKLETLESYLKRASDRTLLKHFEVIIGVDLQLQTWKH